MIIAKEKLFIKAREEFEAMLNWINQVDEDGLRIDQVERGCFRGCWRSVLNCSRRMSRSLVMAMRARRFAERAARCVVRPSHTDAGICRSLES